MAEIAFRDPVRGDIGPLSKIADDEWRFRVYSEEHGLDFAAYYIVKCIHGANTASTLTVDGEPCGIVVVGGMPGETLDLSEDLSRYAELLEDLEDFGPCRRDLVELERIYGEFASRFRESGWAQLTLLLLSDRHKGLGLGRRMLEYASKCASTAGMKGLYFFTDNECNVGFYDHMGAVRFAEESMVCAGEILKVYGYYLEFRPFCIKSTGARLYRVENIERLP
jgi:GNAT superfamily N-acetyltransferase